MPDIIKDYTRPLIVATLAAAGVTAGLLAALLLDPDSRAKVVVALESLAAATEGKDKAGE